MKAISRYPVPNLSGLPKDIRSLMASVREKAGFVPNVLRAMSHRPAELRAFLAYNAALMEKESGLSKAEREMIVVVISSANQCSYCVVAHSAVLRLRAKNSRVADQLAINYHKADITPRQKAMLDFAMKVSHESHRVEDADFAALHAHGFSNEDVWDIAGIVAFYGLSNRMANVLGIRCNEEYYLMGRNID